MRHHIVCRKMLPVFFVDRVCNRYNSCLNATCTVCWFCSQSYMDAEIRQIMSQYMPLDKEAGDDMAGGHMGMQMGGSHEDNFSSSHDAPDTTNNFHPPTLHASEDTINQLWAHSVGHCAAQRGVGVRKCARWGAENLGYGSVLKRIEWLDTLMMCTHRECSL